MSLTELLSISEEVREAVLAKQPSRTIQNLAVAVGMRTLWHSGVVRARAGQTTLEEVARKVASDQL